MSAVNKVIIVGNLGRDPELRHTQSGQPVCKLSVATTRKWKTKEGEPKEETEWHRVNVWGKTAEHCNSYLSKGREVYVEGRLKTSSYEQDGIKKYSTEITALDVQFLGPKGGAQSSSPAPEPYDPGSYSGPAGDDGIPF